MQSRRELLLGSLAATTAIGFGLSACSQNGEVPNALEVVVPSGPGGGWDQTARSIEYVLRTEGLIDEFRIDHAIGGGGAVGLSRFLSTQAGQPDALIVSGLVMVGALAANSSPVRLSDATAIARLTGEYEVVAVHRDSPIQTMRELVEQVLHSQFVPWSTQSCHAVFATICLGTVILGGASTLVVVPKE